MHIADGILETKWWLTWFGASFGFILKGLADITKKSKVYPAFKPLVGLMGAVVFIISLLPIPIPVFGTSSHPVGTPLAAILLGPFITTVLSLIALTLQALFFAHGGITTLGANVFSMGVVGAFVAFGIYKGARKVGLSLVVAAFLAGFFGDLAVYITTTSEIALGLKQNPGFLNTFSKVIVLFLTPQLPLAILEGLLTAGILSYIKKVRPDILKSFGIEG
jgi:cobalt/nickel transport system permease protein